MPRVWQWRQVISLWTCPLQRSHPQCSHQWLEGLGKLRHIVPTSLFPLTGILVRLREIISFLWPNYSGYIVNYSSLPRNGKPNNVPGVILAIHSLQYWGWFMGPRYKQVPTWRLKALAMAYLAGYMGFKKTFLDLYSQLVCAYMHVYNASLNWLGSSYV